MRLLIVEDEKELCDTIAKTLYQAGYEVDTCYDGDAALDYILAENYDLIVLDLNLPGTDGMDILKSHFLFWLKIQASLSHMLPVFLYQT